MKLEHIAISISCLDEITNFYQNILGMHLVRNFTLNKKLAFNIFGINKDVPVYILNIENLYLEIFVTEFKNQKGFNHICFSVQYNERLFNNAKERGYECTRVKRNLNDLFFIRDKTGNIFEIKELHNR